MMNFHLPQTVVTVSYLIAGILFILSLGGLSAQESARRGNLFGIAGMTIAILATMFGPGVSGYGVLLAMLAIGGAVGAALAARVQMTSMPQLVAILHSFVGAAAVLVGFAITGGSHDPSRRNIRRDLRRRSDVHRFGDRVRQAAGRHSE
jgi:NAD(P) transhydrogenase subunit beta